MKKMIILPGKGCLPKNGGMYGPIETPHAAEVHDIGIMLFYGAEVYEVLANGSKVKLTSENYTKDNTGATEDSTEDAEDTEDSPEDTEDDETEDSTEDESAVESAVLKNQAKAKVAEPVVEQPKVQEVQKAEKVAKRK